MTETRLSVKEKSKSTLFLIEQIIVIAVFAICAAVCVRIIVSAYVMTTDAVDLRNALTIAESAAEAVKALDGNASYVGAVLAPGSIETFVVHDDIETRTTFYFENFILQLDLRIDGALVLADIAVSRPGDNDALVTLTTAARRGLTD